MFPILTVKMFVCSPIGLNRKSLEAALPMDFLWNVMEYIACTHAFFAWRVDILWQAKEHPGSGEALRYLDNIQAFDIPTMQDWLKTEERFLKSNLNSLRNMTVM